MAAPPSGPDSARRSPRPELMMLRRASMQAAPRTATGLKMIIAQDYAEMSERVATMIAARVIENPTLNIGVSVGATPTRIYTALKEADARNLAPLDACHFYLFDEFFGKEKEKDGHGLGVAPHLHELRRAFFNPAQIAAENVHSPDASLAPEQAASAYEELFNLRRLDVALVAIGPNGNIGWLSQGRAAADKGVQVVPMADSSFAHGYSSCVSLSLRHLLAAKEVYLLAVNRNKADVVEKALADKDGATAAGWLLHHHPRLFLCLDQPAAQRLIAQHQAPALSVPGFSFLTEESTAGVAGKNIVCFSPHPDDTAISAGATLAMLAANNTVTSCVCTTGHRAYIPNTTAEQRIALRESEATEEARILGARVKFLRLPLYNRSSVVDEEDVRIMAAYLEEAQPHMVFMPQTGDTHQTHRAVAKTILLALQRYQSAHADRPPVELFLYEGPWSLYSKGAYNVIASPSAPFFAKKLAAIQVHKSQTARTAYDRAADSLALLRGALVPEQDLGGWGDQPPTLPDRLELFYKRVAISPEDIQQLLIWLDASTPPKRP